MRCIIFVFAFLLFSSTTALSDGLERAWGFSATERTIADEHVLPNGGKLLTRQSSGIFFTSDTTLSFNGSSYECVYSVHVPSNDPKGRGHGQCYGVDSQGSIWWVQLKGSRNYGTWSFLDGTGRYKGVKGGGSWDATATAGPKKFVTTWKGQWELADE